jgi:hypothetical protein
MIDTERLDIPTEKLVKDLGELKQRRESEEPIHPRYLRLVNLWIDIIEKELCLRAREELERS